MERPNQYLELEAAHIIQTVDRLHSRITERFPESGLSGVCEQLTNIARKAHHRSQAIRQPIMWVRISGALLIAFVAIGIIATLVTISPQASGLGFFEFIQVLEAGINDVILIGAGVFFLLSWETRLKRKKALEALHELRSIAHIIDMHQLTKDPAIILHDAVPTANSPKRVMTVKELGRYFDYCSEMLSITGKIAALYGQYFSDPAAITAVNEIENLTTGLSRKVWQKMMLLIEHSGDAPA
ncbi:MAG: hypothetical protein ACI9TH_000457 [Kiritimatiellia bacterium]|jgi:hypothetical protein